MTYPFAGGPYLEAALLCEKVLQEVDGVKSAIRIVDRIIRKNPAMEMEPFDHEINLFVRFKSGQARGPMPLQIRLTKPSGESPNPARNNILFEGEDDRGVDIVVAMHMRLDQVGLYWFVISLGDTEITRIPFRVVYIPQIMQTLPQDGNQPPAGGA
jgi:hypothetical protein